MKINGEAIDVEGEIDLVFNVCLLCYINRLNTSSNPQAFLLYFLERN